MKLSKESLESFQSALETVDKTWQTEFNLREVVRQSFKSIKRARLHKVSWEKIAEILKQASGKTDEVSPQSIRQYYYEFTKNPKLLLNKKRKAGQSKDTSKNSTSASSTPEIGNINLEASNTNQSTDLQVEPEATLNTQQVSEPIPESASKPPNSENESSNQATLPKTTCKKKDDIRSRFNLGRRSG